MKHLNLYFLVNLLILTYTLNSQTIWNGPDISFSKTAFSNPGMAANQDRITDLVWITRGNTMGLFNAKVESGYNPESPQGTEWAIGTTDNINALNFVSWQEAVNSNPPSSLNEDYVLHLIEEDIYIDLKFTQWGQGQSGGGSFTYTRSTEATSALNISDEKKPIIYPNPASTAIFLVNNNNVSQYKIYSVDGSTLLQKGTVQNNGSIDVSVLEGGSYLLSIENLTPVVFLKLP